MSAKRRLNDEIIEVDLNEPTPLSKKQKRLLKKGKLEIKEVEVKETKEGKSERHYVWIGNLSFNTTKKDLIGFIENRFERKGKKIDIKKDVLKIKLPSSDRNVKLNKGFAFIDFSNGELVEDMISFNENELLNRNLLIKNGTDYNGRPKVALKEGDGGESGAGTGTGTGTGESNGKESHILFIGNLSFETLEKDIEVLYLKYTDKINKIRMGTFQDTNKCKGWCFINFDSVDTCKLAIKDKNCKYLMGRKLRLEFGEDRSKRRPNMSKNYPAKEREEGGETSNYSHGDGQKLHPERAERVDRHNERSERSERFDKGERSEKPQRFDRFERKPFRSQRSKILSSVALATAQRASAAIVPSTGKKIKFD